MMTEQFASLFLLSFGAAVGATLVVRATARKWRIVDEPTGGRKIHRRATPLLGGVGIAIAVYAAGYFAFDSLVARGLMPVHMYAVALAGGIIVIGGVLDDIYSLTPSRQIALPLIAAGILAAGGVGIEKATNPLGGLVYFTDGFTMALTFVWVLGMMYTTKLLDGVDGLVSGLGVIAGLIIFLFTMTTRYYQPDVGLLALIFAAACLGFWLFNFNPASIFLGESGSLFIGYAIAVLAIVSGGKVAIAFLVMGIPIFDVAWIIARRLYEGKNPFRVSDRKHLHHRFLDWGLSQRQTVAVYYALAAGFGMAALFLQSRGKLVAIGVLAVIMALIAFAAVWLPERLTQKRG